MSRSGRQAAVTFYSGYRGQETPRAVSLGGRECPVDEVLSRRRELDRETGTVSEVFRVRVAGRELSIRTTDPGEAEILTPDDPPLAS